MRITFAFTAMAWLFIFNFIPGLVPGGYFGAPEDYRALAQQGEGADAPRRNKRRGPPEEAVAACDGAGEGEGCSFESPRGDFVEGTCEITRADVMACVPEGGPPHGPGGPRGDRPPPSDTGEY